MTTDIYSQPNLTPDKKFLSPSDTKCGRAHKFFDGAISFLESERFVAAAFLVGFLLWFFGLTVTVVAVFSIFFMIIFCTCEDVKNAFALVFYVPFFIQDIGYNLDWQWYLAFIIPAVLSAICFALKNILIGGKRIRKGGMFYGALVALCAFLLGGIGRFDFKTFYITFGLSVAIYFMYFVAVNFTRDFSSYFKYLLIFGAIVLSTQIIIASIRSAVFMEEESRRIDFYCGANINTVAIYVLLGVVSCFFVGYKKKTDVACILLATFFSVAILITTCRTVMALNVAAMLTGIIVLFIKSPKKINYIVLVVFYAVCVLIALCCFKKDIESIIYIIETKISGGSSGRSELWPWCIDRFKEYPWFGYGFVSDLVVPGVRNLEYAHIVMAHNTAIQWLCSLGGIGASMMVYFYLCKYGTILFSSSKDKYYALFLAGTVATTGILDQSPTMDPFVFLIGIVFVAIVESEENNYTDKFVCSLKSFS